MNIITKQIEERQSCRYFTNDLVSDELLKRILLAGIYAPSGKNRQPWRFKIINDSLTINEIAKRLSGINNWVAQARQLIALFLVLDSTYKIEKDYMAMGACIENMLIEATANKIGTSWIGECFDFEEEIRKILGVSNPYILTSIIAVGYSRKNISKIKNTKIEDFLI